MLKRTFLTLAVAGFAMFGAVACDDATINQRGAQELANYGYSCNSYSNSGKWGNSGLPDRFTGTDCWDWDNMRFSRVVCDSYAWAGNSYWYQCEAVGAWTIRHFNANVVV